MDMLIDTEREEKMIWKNTCIHEEKNSQELSTKSFVHNAVFDRRFD